MLYIITWTKGYLKHPEDPETAIESVHNTLEDALKHLEDLKANDLDLESYQEDREEILYSQDEQDGTIELYEIHEYNFKQGE